jgi:5-methyltetrahydrofolate--homocysteine methyltransferase
MEAGKGGDDLPKLTRVYTSAVSRDVPVHIPPDLDRHLQRDYPIGHIMPYVNLQMLLGHHLGLKGKVDKLLEEKDAKALQLKDTIDGIFHAAQKDGIITANGMYRFFPAQSNGNDVIVYDPADSKTVLQTFSFPRQETEPYLCLADYLRSVESGEMDYVGFLVVTAGKGIRELAAEWREKGDYLRSHALQATALEVAEGFAERIHHMMRDVWGIADRADMTMQERFGAKYTGQRYSFGYPACPNLDDQIKLFALMQPEDMGVELTEGSMMEPEASVSAIVFAHPEARYFNVDKV